MNPPLELGTPRSPAPRVVTPHQVHDLRGDAIRELRYPAGAAVIITGVPGAGKSTALKKLFGATADGFEPPVSPAGAMVLDSQHSRNSWHRRLGGVPYPLWLPIVHVTHYARIRRALREAAGPVVIHDCGTRQWVRRLVSAWAANTGRTLHLIMIDAPAEAALAGQVSRGREVGRLSFQWHVARWQRLVDLATAGVMPRPTPDSVVILNRTNVVELQGISFAR
ncbi:AAA family ATPase [Nocardia crassostreae]|uniref:AAA family ATPase n=1 Tax=Nocardia crassostreae TaxID=53428 RepID=UPI000833DFDE|nr:AAA family ATPase [Nocardia crassostreae]